MTQESRSGLDAEVPGPALKYIHIAERIFAREGLNVDDYIVRVFEEDDSVSVILKDPKKPRARGGGFEVEISKTTKKVIRYNYTR